MSIIKSSFSELSFIRLVEKFSKYFKSNLSSIDNFCIQSFFKFFSEILSAWKLRTVKQSIKARFIQASKLKLKKKKSISKIAQNLLNMYASTMGIRFSWDCFGCKSWRRFRSNWRSKPIKPLRRNTRTLCWLKRKTIARSTIVSNCLLNPKSWRQTIHGTVPSVKNTRKPRSKYICGSCQNIWS